MAGIIEPRNPYVVTDEHGRTLYAMPAVPIYRAMRAGVAYVRPDLVGVHGTKPADRRRAFRNTFKQRCIDCGRAFDDPRSVDLDHRDPKTKKIYHRNAQERDNGDAAKVQWSDTRFFREMTLLDPVCRPCHVVRTEAQRRSQDEQEV